MTLLLHPGFHKTATSWLQGSVFAEPRLFRSLMTHEQIDELLVRPHDFDFKPEAARAHIAALREGSKPGVVDVISSEILSGNIIMGSRDSLALAKRLASSSPDARVLLTVRSQLPIMKSVYLQYIKRGGRLDIEEYLTFKPEPGYFLFDPGVLAFDRLAEAYAEYFGAQNVLVLPQELLSRDRGRFLRLLFDYVGHAESEAENELRHVSAVGVSPPTSGIGLLRVANAFRQSPFNPGSSGRLNAVGTMIQSAGYRWTFGEARADGRIENVIKSALAGKFGASNLRLQRFVPVDLAALGYEVGS